MRVAPSLLLWLASFACAAAQSADSPALLRRVQTIDLTGVEGRIDHLALDRRQSRLYVAALGNGTLEVVDLAVGKALPAQGVRSQLKEPQGLVLLKNGSELAFTTGADGLLHVLDTVHQTESKRLAVGGDADNVRLDANTGRLYVGCEEGLAVVDVKEWQRLGVIALAGHAESLQLEEKGARIFVNVPAAQHVAVVDRVERKVLTTWPVSSAAANYPMALDEAGQRLFVGCREPAKIVVLDLKTGAELDSKPCSGDCDDLWFDATSQRLYVSGGEGFISVFEVPPFNAPQSQSPAKDALQLLESVATAAGARTCLLAADVGRLYLAVPQRGNQKAQVWVYETLPRPQ